MTATGAMASDCTHTIVQRCDLCFVLRLIMFAFCVQIS